MIVFGVCINFGGFLNWGSKISNIEFVTARSFSGHFRPSVTPAWIFAPEGPPPQWLPRHHSEMRVLMMRLATPAHCHPFCHRR